MRFLHLAAVAAACGALAGCGGGGGGGGGTGPSGPPAIPSNTFTATTDTIGTFTSTLQAANASGTTIQVYGDARTGPSNNFTSSHRLTITLYGTLSAGEALNVGTSHAAGTAVATYLDTENTNGQTKIAGQWNASAGTININKADNSHVEGTFTLTTVNPVTANTIHWTNGKFNVNFETPPPPTG